MPATTEAATSCSSCLQPNASLLCFRLSFQVLLAWNPGLQYQSVSEASAKGEQARRRARSVEGENARGVHQREGDGRRQHTRGAQAKREGRWGQRIADKRRVNGGTWQRRATQPCRCGAHSLADAAASLLPAEASPLSAPLGSEPAGSSRNDTLTMAARSSLSPKVKPCTPTNSRAG